jgi:hypothetical protein
VYVQRNLIFSDSDTLVLPVNLGKKTLITNRALGLSVQKKSRCANCKLSDWFNFTTSDKTILISVSGTFSPQNTFSISENLFFKAVKDKWVCNFCYSYKKKSLKRLLTNLVFQQKPSKTRFKCECVKFKRYHFTKSSNLLKFCAIVIAVLWINFEFTSVGYNLFFSCCECKNLDLRWPED